MPLTAKGFQRQTYDDILTVLTERTKLLFGEDMDTAENSTYGKILRLLCLAASESYETAELVYLSSFPHTATGVSLDRLCPRAGISRNPATHAQHEVKITGTAGAVVDMGFLVSTGEVVFHTVDYNTIGEDGTVTAIVECNDAGTVGNVPVGAIKHVVNPDANVTGIEHLAILALGEEIETDYALRSRFVTAQSGTGSGTLDAVRGAIMRVQNVETVYIEENDSDEAVNGIPPHSFRCYVHAPVTAKQEIGEAIFSKKPLGIGTAGTQAVSVVDASGLEKIINFSWTETVYIHVKCSISVDGTFSTDSLQTIKDSIVNKLATYTNGQNVTATSLYADVYVPGVTDATTLTISADGITYGTETIEIPMEKVARAIAANIEVTVNE